MCPGCMTAAVLAAGGAATGSGVMALAVETWRALRRWLRRSR
jgi:hypothetical protein